MGAVSWVVAGWSNDYIEMWCLGHGPVESASGIARAELSIEQESKRQAEYANNILDASW
jgi:hypothetical protein